MTTYTADQITRIGGQEWRRGDQHRIYINPDVWKALIGLNTTHYKTGNINSATLDGEPISHSRAYDIVSCIDSVYLDVATGELRIMIRRNRYSDQVPGWIRAAIADQVFGQE